MIKPAGDGRYDVDLGLAKCNSHTLESLRGVPLRIIRAVSGLPTGDLSPLAGARPEFLQLNNCKITSLRALHGMPLQRLDLQNAPLESLAGLEGCPLNYADFRGTPLRDLLPLVGAPLKTLKISETNIEDLSPLRGMPLESLECYRTKVRSLEALRGMKLRGLAISNSSVNSLEPLRGMPLERLDMGSTGIDDLSPLVGMPLKNLEMNVAWSIKALAYLRDLPLEYLNIRETRATDFDVLAHLKLKGLDLNMTTFADGNILRGQPLEVLLVATCTKLKDVSFLKDLPQLKALSIPEALVTAARGLPGLRYLSTTDSGGGDDPKMNFVASKMPSVEKFWAEYDAKQAARKVAERAAREAAERLRPQMDKLRQALTDAGIKNLRSDVLTASRSGRIFVNLTGSTIGDLSLLRGFPVDEIHLSRSNVTNIDPLRDMPVVTLYINNTQVTDVKAMLQIPTLRNVILGTNVKNVDVLREAKQIGRLAYDAITEDGYDLPAQTAEEFWKEYDAKQAAEKK